MTPSYLPVRLTPELEGSILSQVREPRFTVLVIWHCINKFQSRVVAVANKAVLIRMALANPAGVALPFFGT